MRRKMEFYFATKKILFTSVFIAGEFKWFVLVSWSALFLSLWNTVFVGPDVSFRMISFWASVYITSITLNETLSPPKCPHWHNIRNEFHFGHFNFAVWPKYYNLRHLRYAVVLNIDFMCASVPKFQELKCKFKYIFFFFYTPLIHTQKY